VEMERIKILGDGTRREHNASVEIGKISGNAVTATSVFPRALNANVVIKKRIGDVINATEIIRLGHFANAEINNDH